MRKITAREHRENAAKIAENRQHPVHVANGEERAYRDAHSFMTFTKGLPHSEKNGLVKDALDPVRLRTAIDNGYTRDFDLGVPLGCRADHGKGELIWHFFDKSKNSASPIALQEQDDGDQYRKWEAPTAGFVYDLQGPDAQAVTMPPAPPIVVMGEKDAYGRVRSGHDIVANPELVAEMAEVYWLALLRDKNLSELDEVAGGSDSLVNAAIGHLGGLPFYITARGAHPRRRLVDGQPLTRQDLFRGHTKGERKGPYLSQFMLMGSRHLGREGMEPRAEEDGKLQYGSISIDMKVRTAKPGRDYMTHWHEWLDVQNGAAVGGTQDYVPEGDADDVPFRHITTLRDLATYVHFDALYEAYLNACLWLLNAGAPFDPNFRHLLSNTRHTTGFALYGGPHILSLMTEVATRGLKAVRFQKFNNHLRLRPEALAGLIAAKLGNATLPDAADKAAEELIRDLGSSLIGRVTAHNQAQNTSNKHDDYIDDQPGTIDGHPNLANAKNLALLPMAFPEGSPMHPSYGAGHATVAGACVTILKAFFDEDACLAREGEGGKVVAVSADEIAADRSRPVGRKNYQPVAFVPEPVETPREPKDTALDDKEGAYGGYLRVGDELNKLAANISIARNMAGVHYYSDYIDSLRMGEEIAIGVLQEQSITYPKDPFQVSLTSFDGKRVIIGDGEVQCLDPETGHDYDQLLVASYDDQKNAAD
ncbi:MAG: bromoperoxidase [Pseudomonadota bacterium]